MKKILFALVLSGINALKSKECSNVTCSGKIPSNNICLDAEEDNQISLYSCPKGYKCNFEQLKSTGAFSSWSSEYCTEVEEESQCSAIEEKSRTTGEVCCKDSDCASEKCVDERCSGLLEGEECRNDEVCQPNHYCKDEKCTPAIELGQPCSRSNQCKLGSGCHKGTCTKYLSLPEGSSSSSARFCLTGITYNSTCDSIKVKEEDLTLEYPYECHIGNYCRYYVRSNEYVFTSSDCMCDGLRSDKGYCGSYIYYLEIEKIKLLTEIDYSQSKCSGDNAHSFDLEVMHKCRTVTEDFYNYFRSYLDSLKYYSLYQSGAIDSCASSLGLFEPMEREPIVEYEEQPEPETFTPNQTQVNYQGEYFNITQIIQYLKNGDAKLEYIIDSSQVLVCSFLMLVMN